MNKLLASLLTASLSVGFAQTLPFDFESATAGMQGYDGATFTIVPNPSLVGNTSSNVAKIVKVNANDLWAGGRIAGVTSLNFTTAETSILSMDVYTTQPVGTVIKVKLEAPYTSEVDAITTVSGGWQTLLFDFGIPAPSGSANLIIMPQPFTNGGGNTFYFDNIEQIGGSIAIPLPGLPITFESGTNTDHFFSFESAQLTVVPNPLRDSGEYQRNGRKNCSPPGRPLWRKQNNLHQPYKLRDPHRAHDEGLDLGTHRYQRYPQNREALLGRGTQRANDQNLRMGDPFF